MTFLTISHPVEEAGRLFGLRFGRYGDPWRTRHAHGKQSRIVPILRLDKTRGIHNA